MAENSFICLHCQKKVLIHNQMATKHRNHCNFCLWSKHLDQKVSGDRKSLCHGAMKPIGVTFKLEGKGRKGEIMLVHQCTKCNKVSINRTAADDDSKQIISVFETSIKKASLIKELKNQNIQLLEESDRVEVLTQLYGKN